MAYDGAKKAAVIGVPHERWDERSVAFIVPMEAPTRPAGA
jgi:fatty-acyl-CoA synthase